MQHDHLGDNDGASVVDTDSVGAVKVVGTAVAGGNVVLPPRSSAIVSEQTRQHPSIISKQRTSPTRLPA